MIVVGILMVLNSRKLIRLTVQGQKELFGLKFDPNKNQWSYVAVGIILIIFGGFAVCGKIEFDPKKIRVSKCTQKHGLWDPQRKVCGEIP